MTTIKMMMLAAALMLVPTAAFAGDSPAKKTDDAAGNPVVVMETNHGKVEIELWPKKAPQTVANFLKYVDAKFYDGTIFHRVIAGFMVQGGGFTPDFKKKETNPPVQNEADNGELNVKYTVAMARTPDPHSATAQFFVNVSNNGFLNHKSKTPRGWGYCVFGKVIAGQEIVDKIAASKTGAAGPFGKDVPKEAVTILKITRK